ncbi:methyltransferase domain-containing protein [Leifsonia sp. YIM 134122]|uniref:Methyltransferase domain-containing protein n=1 Tax=Leifsonia stereocauli TaxID=3134136 RepID=A0ABU9W3J9_9MICO
MTQSNAPAVPASALPPLAPRALLRWRVVRRVMKALAPATIVEVGIGEGAMGARLATLADYRGVEPDPISCARAREVIEPLGGRVANGFLDDVDPGPAPDVICAFEVLEHIDDHRAALADWVAHLPSGAHLVLSVPAFAKRFGPSDVRSGHFRRYDPPMLRTLMEEEGLVGVEVIVYAWPLGYALEAVRNRRDERKLANTEYSITELTAASGRTGQPRSRVLGTAILIGTSPFMLLQRFAKGRGTGLVAIGRRP